ncbi:hypothetical protein Z042_00980 [Chania multitudinisentens RB-25]|uniref:Fimbrial-type adhesion domain-containing protein n=1 Tax=Chania multitudinisentens RB-25 TaxID=1441930 RepID=W0LJP6_9GAMM|nr:fimbrial protein [Chania multitudinisentens]AHG22562.1 hypothetical protein Z042_00980 [Chania multitudinisentens RB-25]
MCKPLLNLTPAALLLLMVTSSVQAASNAQMIITASVVAAACDVSLSTSNLDLGNYTPSDFSGVANPISASKKQFIVGISNCQTPLAANDIAQLTITGQTLAGNPTLFNSNNTNTGVMLSQVSTPTDYLKNGDVLSVATAGGTPSTEDFNGKTLSLQAGLAATTTSGINFGAVNAPILFSFTYN